jgi:hypothetical protein
MLEVKSRKYYLTFIGWGVFLWAAFLVFMRLLGTPVFSTGNPLLLGAYVVSVPVVFGLIIFIARLTKTAIHDMLIPIVIIDATALLLDGLAVGFTNFYGDTPDQIAASGAYLLWGVAWTLILALWLAYRR